jgi:hypothetical protein
MLNALSVVPAYVRELERQNAILQQSNKMNASHVLQLEKQYVHRIRRNAVISFRTIGLCTFSCQATEN